ncbi:hypothetical protein [Natronococcus roseus]|uniref:hypothetical protein n=1 Tax=Natronococcus roseus TaxID=1052014 RepID=UPI00374CBC02
MSDDSEQENERDIEVLRVFAEDLRDGVVSLEFIDAPFGRKVGISYGGSMGEMGLGGTRPLPQFQSMYVVLIERIDEGELGVVEELSEEEWPLFVEVCGHVEGWDVDVDELREA